MGEQPCNLLDVELALDRIDAELAAELPPHMRAFAAAYAEGRPVPAAPTIVRRASTLAMARNALMHDVLVDRGLALLRLVAPIAIEDQPAVVAARRAERSWDSYAALCAAREAATRARFGIGAIELMHRLHGSAALAASTEEDDLPPPIDGWHEVDRDIDPDELWRAIRARTEIPGRVQIVVGGTHPRCFVIEPGREVRVVLPAAITTPATRFAVLHELGHAVVALVAPAGVPRVVDEAVASLFGRLVESGSSLPTPWTTPLAVAARARRLALARRLDAIERGLASPLGARPPWALWHDPGAQAAYVAAERLADAWAERLAGASDTRTLADAIAVERDRIDRATRL